MSSCRKACFHWNAVRKMIQNLVHLLYTRRRKKRHNQNDQGPKCFSWGIATNHEAAWGLSGASASVDLRTPDVSSSSSFPVSQHGLNPDRIQTCVMPIPPEKDAFIFLACLLHHFPLRCRSLSLRALWASLQHGSCLLWCLSPRNPPCFPVWGWRESVEFPFTS